MYREIETKGRIAKKQISRRMKGEKGIAMPKFWESSLESHRDKGELVLLPINHPEYAAGYGTYLFTTPEIRAWLRQNDKPKNPPSSNLIWDDQEETIYFAFKDQEIVYHGHERDEAKAGFFVCVYSNNDELRRAVMREMVSLIPKHKIFETALQHYQGENSPRDNRVYWRSWEVDITPENLEEIVELVVTLISDAICKIVL